MTDEQNINVEDDGEDEEEEGDEGVFEVDFIMDTKMTKGVRYFYVRWKGFDETEDSWEPEENLEGAREIVRKFMADLGAKKKAGGRASSKTTTPKPRKSTTPAPARKRVTRASRETTAEPEEKDDEDSDVEYGKSANKKRKTTEKPSTSAAPPSATQRPGATGYTSLDATIRRRMNKNLGWLGEDSDEEKNLSGAIIEQSARIPEPAKHGTEAKWGVVGASNAGEDSENSKSKEKKKKKKSKKHSKDRERSQSPESARQAAPAENNNMTEKGSSTFLGVFHPDGAPKGDYRFVVRNNATGSVSMMTLGESFLADSWQLCRYLASKISFKPNGEQMIELSQSNGDVNK